MKRLLVLLTASMLLALFTMRARAYTVNLDAGQLVVSGSVNMNSSASPNGSLLLLVGLTSGTNFSETLQTGQYVPSNEIILSATSFNTGNGMNETSNFITNISTGSQGEDIALMWFPSITYQQYLSGTLPSIGTAFGTFYPGMGSDINHPGTPTGTAFDAGSAWVVPGSSATVNLDFYTTNVDPGVVGTEAPSEGFANFIVVPEPSTCALIALGIPLLWRGFRRWNFRFRPCSGDVDPA